MKGLASVNIKCKRPLHFKEKVKHMKTYGLHYSSSLCSLAIEFKWNYELMGMHTAEVNSTRMYEIPVPRLTKEFFLISIEQH